MQRVHTPAHAHVDMGAPLALPFPPPHTLPLFILLLSLSFAPATPWDTEALDRVRETCSQTSLHSMDRGPLRTICEAWASPAPALTAAATPTGTARAAATAALTAQPWPRRGADIESPLQSKPLSLRSPRLAAAFTVMDRPPSFTRRDTGSALGDTLSILNTACTNSCIFKGTFVILCTIKSPHAFILSLEFLNCRQAYAEFASGQNISMSFTNLMSEVDLVVEWDALFGRDVFVDIELQGSLEEASVSALLASNPRLTYLTISTCTELLKTANCQMRANGGLTSVPPEITHMEGLVSLDLSYNRITSIPEGIFSNIPGLQLLILFSNHITSLPEATFAQKQSLMYILLSDNKIAEVAPRTFHNLPNLLYLDLSGNDVASLPSELFDESLASLASLDLKANNITSLPPSVFHNLVSLQQLILEGNSIAAVPSDAFSENILLSTIDLSSNRIAELPDSGVFGRLTALIELDLSSNDLTALPQGLFDSLTALANLTFSSNHVRALPPGLFEQTTALKNLFFADNMVEGLPEGIFDRLTALQALHIAINIISAPRPGVFRSLTQLKRLDMAANGITSLPRGLFDHLSRLELLQLNYNSISSVAASGVFDSLTNLLQLGLSGSGLRSLPPHVFDRLTLLSSISLIYNFLTELPPGIFDKLTALNFLDMSSNQITTLNDDVFLHLTSLTYLSMGRNPLARLPSLRMLTDVSYMNLAELHLLEVPDFSKFRQLSFLNVSSNRLSVWPSIPSTVSFLNVSNNPDMLLPSTELFGGNPFSTLDVSGTRAVSPASLACRWSARRDRMNLFQVQGVRFERGDDPRDLASFLETCLLRVDLLDFSGNSQRNLTLLQRVLDGINFIVPVMFFDVFGEAHVGILQLGAQSPVQCDLVRRGTKRELFTVEQILPSLSYQCSCSPSFVLSGSGICQPTPPFWTGGKVGGLVIGTMLLSFAIAAAVVLVSRRHRRVREDLELHRLLLEDTQDEVTALKLAWEILPSEILLEARVDGDSPGAFGEVWRGRWENMVVAVKMLQQGVMDLDEVALEEFHKEVEFMQRTRHPSIVRFFGAGTWPDGRPFFVVELVSQGSLKSFLRGSRSTESTPDVPWTLRVSLALDVARGMAYIHSLGQMHRDLKSGNVLITDQNRAKIADFGTIRQLLTGRQRARNAHAQERTAQPAQAVSGDMELTAGKGTPLYMSPEVIRGSAYDQKADVWSYGVLLWEIGAQRTPDLLEQEGTSRGPMLGRLLSLLESGKRLKQDPAWPSWFSTLMSKCWMQQLEERPSFEDIVRVVESQQ